MKRKFSGDDSVVAKRGVQESTALPLDPVLEKPDDEKPIEKPSESNDPDTSNGKGCESLGKSGTDEKRSHIRFFKKYPRFDELLAMSNEEFARMSSGRTDDWSDVLTESLPAALHIEDAKMLVSYMKKTLIKLDNASAQRTLHKMRLNLFYSRSIQSTGIGSPGIMIMPHLCKIFREALKLDRETAMAFAGKLCMPEVGHFLECSDHGEFRKQKAESAFEHPIFAFLPKGRYAIVGSTALKILLGIFHEVEIKPNDLDVSVSVIDGDETVKLVKAIRQKHEVVYDQNTVRVTVDGYTPVQLLFGKTPDPVELLKYCIAGPERQRMLEDPEFDMTPRAFWKALYGDLGQEGVDDLKVAEVAEVAEVKKANESQLKFQQQLARAPELLFEKVLRFDMAPLHCFVTPSSAGTTPACEYALLDNHVYYTAHLNTVSWLDRKHSGKSLVYKMPLCGNRIWKMLNRGFSVDIEGSCFSPTSKPMPAEFERVRHCSGSINEADLKIFHLEDAYSSLALEYDADVLQILEDSV
jgi:hypothetical protein